MNEQDKPKDDTNVSDAPFGTVIVIPVTEQGKDLSVESEVSVELDQSVLDLQAKEDKALAEVFEKAEKILFNFNHPMMGGGGGTGGPDDW